MSHGIPVIAYGKGCIDEIIEINSGFVINANKNFTDLAVKQIVNWIDNSDVFNKIRINARNNFTSTEYKSKETLEYLIYQITKPNN
jgi:glycosyltransferase involved in cell wall biosynthesis